MVLDPPFAVIETLSFFLSFFFTVINRTIQFVHFAHHDVMYSCQFYHLLGTKTHFIGSLCGPETQGCETEAGAQG